MPLLSFTGSAKPGGVHCPGVSHSYGKRQALIVFANDVQPIFTQRCATTGGCHDSSFRAQNQALDAGEAYANIVGKPSSEGGKLLVVAPGSIAKSFLARKITGKGLKGSNGTLMPFGCPLAPGVGGCLTDAEIYTILAWIQAGAPNN